MNKNNILVAIMETFELDIKQMAKFSEFDLKVFKELKRLENAAFTNGELDTLYFFFGVDTYDEIYDILLSMSDVQKGNILTKIENEIS